MRNIHACAALFSFWSALGCAQTNQDLINDGKNTDNVMTQSMGYDRKSYSPLSADQQVERQAPGADLEHQPDERAGRARRADGLQRRDVRHQRQVDASPSTWRPAGRSGARR